MDSFFKNKKILITGASGSLGSQLAEDFSIYNVKLILQGRSLSKLKKIKIKNKNSHKLISLDFKKENSINKLEEFFKKNFYPDIVIHCLGGSFGVNKTFSSKEDWLKVWNMNLGYSHEINNLVIPKMIKKKIGRIVHISSIATTFLKGNAPYISAKYALEGYVKSVSKEISKKNVIMLCVSPGIIDIRNRYFNKLKKQNKKKYFEFMKAHIPINRMAKIKEISNLILILSSNYSSYMPGSIIKIDGQGN